VLNTCDLKVSCGQMMSPSVRIRFVTLGAPCEIRVFATHAAEVIAWLKAQGEVKRLLSPALPEDPGHALWRRDFNGANGLLSVEFAAPITPAAADRLVDSLCLFGIGASWGGYESLALTYLLIADLAQGFRAAFG
jgi:cystathionine beta-lyase/cystathionine gamma-synthase